MKHRIEHPSAFIASAVTDEIRETAFEAEVLRRLHDRQLTKIFEHNWFNMYVPEKYGGLALEFPDILRIEEGLGWADGSTAWVVTLCSGAAWFTGFLDPDLAREIFEDDRPCFAGSGAVTGIANKTAGGYAIDGYWKYATGSLHATLFTVNCHVKEDGTQLYNSDGTPVVRAFLLKKNEVVVHNTWRCMGMIATGSHAIEIKQLHVPLNRCFIIDPGHAVIEHPLYHYPFLQLAETTLAVNLSGMACRFLDLCSEIFSFEVRNNSQTPALLQKLEEKRSILDTHRDAFYRHTDMAWKTLVTQSDIPHSVRAEVSNVSHGLAHCSRQLADELYPYCGLVAADTNNEINRVWRNLHTASQHSLFKIKV